MRRVIKYYNVSDDSKADKVMVLGFIIVSLAYALVNYDCTPLIFSETTTPFYLNNIFLIDLFLFGYCYFKSEVKKESKEVVPEVEEEPVQEEDVTNEEQI